jgi:hypothetical protein
LRAGRLPANAAVVVATYGAIDLRFVSNGREISTKTEWAGRLSPQPDADNFAVVRPTRGDWPEGQILVGGATIEVGAAIEAAPPQCDYIGGRYELGAYEFPGGGGQAAEVGFAHAGITDLYGTIVLCTVDFTIDGELRTVQRAVAADGHNGAVTVGPALGEIKRIRLTNVVGKTLELLPPFPRGTPPAGPFCPA